MANFITGIISLSISAVVLASVFIYTVKNTNQTYVCYLANGDPSACGWGVSEIALWGLITLVAIAGMVYGVMNVFGLQ